MAGRGRAILFVSPCSQATSALDTAGDCFAVLWIGRRTNRLRYCKPIQICGVKTFSARGGKLSGAPSFSGARRGGGLQNAVASTAGCQLTVKRADDAEPGFFMSIARFRRFYPIRRATMSWRRCRLTAQDKGEGCEMRGEYSGLHCTPIIRLTFPASLKTAFHRGCTKTAAPLSWSAGPRAKWAGVCAPLTK